MFYLWALYLLQLWKHSTAGACATCGAWRHCRMWLSASDWGRRASACNNWPVAELCARLGARALATQELRLRLELENGWHAEDDCCPSTALDPSDRRIFQRTLRLPVPLLDARIFLKLLQLDLKANPPGAPIVKIYLSAEPVRPRAAQSGLFLPPSPEPEKLELTLARITGIVGEGSVGSLEILVTHHPHGFRMRRFAPAEPQRLEPQSSSGDK